MREPRPAPAAGARSIARRVRPLWMLLLVVASGCDAPRDIPRPDGPPPTATAWADAQCRRAKAVPSLGLRGHAQFEWRDAQGAHFDDGDFDIICRPPAELCLRLSKLGQKGLWVGAGGGQAWVVFLNERPVRAVHRLDADPTRAPAGLAESIPGIEQFIDPDRLAEALGIAPGDAAAVQSVDWDGRLGAWSITLPHRRVFARGENLLPVGIEWLDDSGAVIARSTLERFEWIRGERGGAPSDASMPLVPTRIRIDVWNGGRSARSGTPDGSVLLHAAEPTDAAVRLRPQMFSWDDVRMSTRPEVIEAWE